VTAFPRMGRGPVTPLSRKNLPGCPTNPRSLAMSFHLSPSADATPSSDAVAADVEVPSAHAGGPSGPKHFGEARSGLKAHLHGAGAFAFDASLELRHAGKRRVVVRGELVGAADAPLVI